MKDHKRIEVGLQLSKGHSTTRVSDQLKHSSNREDDFLQVPLLALPLLRIHPPAHWTNSCALFPNSLQ